MGEFTVADLPYGYAALEPHIDEQTMRLHHDKHHQTYVTNLNAALKTQPKWQDKSIEEILGSIGQLPSDISGVVRNHGGGHANHSLFWTILTPDGGGEPQGEIAQAIDKKFGSFKEFKEQFSTAATKVFGSGWAWLVAVGGSVDLISTPNQDSPLMEGKTPLMGLDVWEHAYYLKYQNRRPDYIEAWWNVVNWPEISRRFKQAS